MANFSSRQLQVAASELMRFQMGVCLLRLVITNDTGGRSNWGCQATSRAFEAFVRDAFAGFQDPVLDKIPLAAPHPLDRSFQALFGRTIREVYSQMEPEKKCLELLENLARERFQSQYQKIEQADVVLFQGEGSVGPAWTFENLRVFALPVLAARRLGKPVFALNQTIYAANASDAKVLRSIYSGFSMVCVREARSYDFARSIGIDNALLCPDFAFGVPVNTRKYRVNLPNRYFCVTGSAAAHAFDNDRYAALIKLLSATFKAKPVFMHSRRKDRLEMVEVLKTFNSDEFIEFSSEDYPDSIQLRHLLENALFAIGGRYHTGVVALGLGTPTIFFPGNTFKSEGIGPMLELDVDVVQETDQSTIVARLQTLLENRSETRSLILAKIDSLERKFSAMSEYLANAARCVVAEQPLPPAPNVLSPQKFSQEWSDRHSEIYSRSNAKKRKLPRIAPLERAKLARLRRAHGYAKSLEDSFINLP